MSMFSVNSVFALVIVSSERMPHLFTKLFKYVPLPSMRKKTRRRKDLPPTLMFLEWLPVLIILALFALSYYVYVVEFCIFTIKSPTKRIIYLLSFHLIGLMTLWSYYMAIFTDLGTVPDLFRIPLPETYHLLFQDNEEEVLERLVSRLPVETRGDLNGKIRYCTTCWIIKPDRTHHCSACDKCTMRMDHHCPFIRNCIGFRNQKFLVLFLVYLTLDCIQVILTTFESTVDFYYGVAVNVHVVKLFFFANFVGMGVIGSFTACCCYLLGVNKTTLEWKRAPVFTVDPACNNGRRYIGGETCADGTNLFNVGLCENVAQIFGNNVFLWFFPVFSSSMNGYSFPIVRTSELTNNHCSCC